MLCAEEIELDTRWSIRHQIANTESFTLVIMLNEPKVIGEPGLALGDGATSGASGGGV